MSYLQEAIKLQKTNGDISQPYLMRKLKVTASEAQNLIEQVDKVLLEEEVKRISKLKKIELHLTAEYE